MAKVEVEVQTIVRGNDLEKLPGDIDTAASKINTSFAKADTGGIDRVNESIDRTRGKAGELAGSGAGFASQFLGPYSEGIGLFGDLTEQVGNLKREASEAGTGTSGIVKGLAGMAGGLAAAAGLGMIFDSFSKDAADLSTKLGEVNQGIADMTSSLVENGGQWDANTVKSRIWAISQSSTFVDLVSKGANWNDTMDAFLKGNVESWGRVNTQVLSNSDNLTSATVNSLKAGSAMVASGRQAEGAAGQYAEYYAANGIVQEKAEGAAAAVRDANGVLQINAGNATAAAGAVGDAADANQRFNDNPVRDQAATVSVDSAGAAEARQDVVNAATNYGAGYTSTINVVATGIQAIIGTLNSAFGGLGIRLERGEEDTDQMLFMAGGANQPHTLQVPGSGTLLGTLNVPVGAGMVAISVNGALDPVAVARQLKRLLRSDTRSRSVVQI